MNKLLLKIMLLLSMAVPSARASDLAQEKLIIQSGNAKHAFVVEIADNDVTREQGLMFRKSLAKDNGMLFVFRRYEEQNFWMKNTLIPLDIIFIDKGGEIIKVHSMAKPKDLTLIPSGAPVAAALEIPGGEAQKRGIKAGDRVIYKLFTK